MPKFLIWDENVIDRCGDRILADGLNIENYKKNPIILFNHNNAGSYGEVESKVIGKSLSIEKNDGKIFIDVLFDDGDDDAAKIKRKVEGGFLNAVSIGFRCIEVNDQLPYLPGQKYATITKAELLEVSIVELPAHPDAVRQKSYIVQHEKPAKAEEKNMEEEIKALKKNVDELTLLVQGLVSSKSAEEVEKIKGENAEIKKELDEIKTKSNFTLADVVGAIKNGNAHNTTEDRSAWTIFDWNKKDPEGLEKMKSSDPEKYAITVKKLR